MRKAQKSRKWKWSDISQKKIATIGTLADQSEFTACKRRRSEHKIWDFRIWDSQNTQNFLKHWKTQPKVTSNKTQIQKQHIFVALSTERKFVAYERRMRERKRIRLCTHRSSAGLMLSAFSGIFEAVGCDNTQSFLIAPSALTTRVQFWSGMCWESAIPSRSCRTLASCTDPIFWVSSGYFEDFRCENAYTFLLAPLVLAK